MVMTRIFQSLVIMMMLVIGVLMLFDLYIVFALFGSPLFELMTEKRVTEWLIMVPSMTILLGALIWSKQKEKI